MGESERCGAQSQGHAIESATMDYTNTTYTGPLVIENPHTDGRLPVRLGEMHVSAPWTELPPPGPDEIRPLPCRSCS